MLKYLLIFVVCLMLNSGLAQQATVAWVKENQVTIKWFPKNFEQTKIILTQGATIQRIELKDNEKAEEANYEEATRFTVNPLKKTFDQLDENDPIQDKHKVLLEPFFTTRSQAPSAKNFAFGLFLIANASDSLFQNSCNNWFTDSTIQSGKRYGYRIVVKNIQPWFVTVENIQTTSYPTPEFQLKLDLRKTVEITWPAKTYEQFFFAWDIEFALDQPNSVRILNDQPYIPFSSEHEKPNTPNSFRHDDTQQGHWHYYRIVGYNHFGGRVGKSEWQKIYVPKRINAWLAVDTIYAENTSRIVKIIAHSDGNTSNIEGYRILRSTQRDSGFVQLNQIMSTEHKATFILNDYSTGEAFYYIAEAFGSGDTIRSLPYYFFTLDQEPPDAPTELQGTIDSLGIVTLRWSAPQATDLKGYRIFRSNSLTSEPIEITKTLTLATQHLDTLRLDNLTREVYYWVQAVDNNFNNSPQSAALRLLKPDTIAPIAPIIRAILVDSGQVQLHWTHSPSTDRAVFWLCRTCSQKDTLLLSSDFSVINLSIDAPAGVSCIYTLTVTDSSGNSSNSLPYAYTYEPGFRAGVANLQAQVDRNNRQILLTWQSPHEKVYHYEIYRATGRNKPKLYATLGDAEATSFKDLDLQANNQYTYIVKYVTDKGIHSLVMEIVVVY